MTEQRKDLIELMRLENLICKLTAALIQADADENRKQEMRKGEQQSVKMKN